MTCLNCFKIFAPNRPCHQLCYFKKH